MSAVDIAPKFVPTDELYARDNSGGPGFDPHCGMFGDHSVTGSKEYLGGGSKKGGRKGRKSDNDGDDY